MSSGDFRTHSLKRDRDAVSILVERGNESEAIQYYRQIGRDFVHISDDILTSSLRDVLAYCGYDGLSPTSAETLPSRDLMRLAADDRILATVFFAPKIIDVSGQTEPIQYGWRKLVRLRATPESRATADGIVSAFVLFNFSDEKPRFPDKPAGQIQVILVRDLAGDVGLPVYFLVYGAQPDYRIKTFLNASFDGATGPPNEQYFVPRACAQCHGAEEGLQLAKLNYLDTDHWFDRAESDDDFPKIKRRHVLPDAGSRLFFWKFHRAFDVYRKLNNEIREQNVDVDPASFQVRAVDKWLALHSSSDCHFEPIERGIGGVTTNELWNKGNTNDEALLPLLNRYCFRCHSSFKYHVFDKEAVKKLAKREIEIRPQDLVKLGVMPQDRELDATTKALVVRLLDNLASESK